MRTLSLNLGSHLEGYMKKQIDSGRYKSENELISAGLSLLEKVEDESFMNLKNALQDGIDSGFKPYDKKKFVDRISKKFVN